MKKVAIFLIVISICIGCGKNNENSSTDSSYCDVKDPQNDLEWLRLEIKNHKITSDSVFVQKMELPTFGEKGFLFQYEIKGSGGSLPVQRYYYTCKGTLICYDLGGFTGTNCGSKLNDIKLGDVIYKSF
jgi:hypothetical protein